MRVHTVEEVGGGEKEEEGGRGGGRGGEGRCGGDCRGCGDVERIKD